MASRSCDVVSGKEKSEIRLILVGLKGSGKSATGNTILGSSVFDEHSGGESTETKCRHGKSVINDHSVLVVDTPSLIGKNTSAEQFSREVAKCILLSSPGPHAVLLVISLGRHSKDLQMAPRLLEEVFGVDVKKYIIVVLTGGDKLQKSKTSKEDCIKDAPEHMKGIYKKYPVVLMNNLEENAREKQQQVEELLREVMTRNEKYMSNELYKKIEERLLRAEEESRHDRAVYDR